MSSNSDQNSGTTSLHRAVECQDIAKVEHLIVQGCDVNARNACGVTPLILAVQNRNEAIVDTLLRSNADIFVANSSGVSPLEIAFRACLRYAPLKSTNLNLIILKKLLETITSDLSMNEQSLLNSSELVKLIVVAGGNAELADLVLKNGYAVDFHEPKRGLTALHCSVIFSKIDNAKLLLARGADIGAVDHCQYSAIFFYTDDCQDVDDNSDLLKNLLSRTATLHLHNVRGYTDFEYLIMYGNERTVKTVLRNAMQSDVDIRTMRFRGGRSLLHALIDNPNDGVVRLFEDVVVHFDASSLNRLDSDGKTALMLPALRNNERALKYLLKHSVIVQSAALSDLTSFVYAARVLDATEPEVLNNMAKITKLLLKRGSDPQFVTVRSATILNDLRNQHGGSNIKMMNPSVKVILAHLALLGAIDNSLLTERTRRDIQAEPLFEAHFVSCTRQLEAMKSVGVHGNVTLFKLLTENEKAVMGYARNRDLILAFDDAMMKNAHFDSFYLDSLREKMSTAMYGIELYETAAPVIEALTGIYSDVYHVIIYKIFSYLSLRDLENITLV